VAMDLSLLKIKFTDWAKKYGIRIDYIQPSNPQQNAYIERANRTIRYNWLSKYLFETLIEVSTMQRSGYGSTIVNGT
jgi:transposase InsO family protein